MAEFVKDGEISRRGTHGYGEPNMLFSGGTATDLYSVNIRNNQSVTDGLKSFLLPEYEPLNKKYGALMKFIRKLLEKKNKSLEECDVSLISIGKKGFCPNASFPVKRFLPC